ncbi:hypothetical protein [Streptosporangium carneum]|uniref:Uncharacterized protein n=1 Tax=Streptosporangium carneum TaxID=47481 RepID=A0A9W6MDW5_9ACTN|nr:hypothetical protein [Streptosporangium carneum]GLK10345.1 hypothetical protein GCM10017600_37510 [Streptosporangium carneum]
MTVEIAGWLFRTINHEVAGAEALAAETDLVTVLGEKTLGPGGGKRFIDHIRSNSEAKIRIVEMFTRNRAVIDGLEDRIREGESLTADDAHLLAVAAIKDEVLSEAITETAYGYRFRPGWKEEWKP